MYHPDIFRIHLVLEDEDVTDKSDANFKAYKALCNKKLILAIVILALTGMEAPHGRRSKGFYFSLCRTLSQVRACMQISRYKKPSHIFYNN